MNVCICCYISISIDYFNEMIVKQLNQGASDAKKLFFQEKLNIGFIEYGYYDQMFKQMLSELQHENSHVDTSKLQYMILDSLPSRAHYEWHL